MLVDARRELRRNRGSGRDARKVLPRLARSPPPLNHQETDRLRQHERTPPARSRSAPRRPTTNTDCHPNRGMIAAATSPPTAAPSEKPQIIIVTAPARRRRGMYSEVSAIAFGIAPPMPSPVRTRKAISEFTDSAVAVSSEPMPKTSTRGDEHRLAADPIGERAADQRAHHHPDQPARDHRAEHAARNLQRRRQRRRDEAHRLRVEPVHEHDERAHAGDQPLIAADRPFVDELPDVENRVWHG